MTGRFGSGWRENIFSGGLGSQAFRENALRRQWRRSGMQRSLASLRMTTVGTGIRFSGVDRETSQATSVGSD